MLDEYLLLIDEIYYIINQENDIEQMQMYDNLIHYETLHLEEIMMISRVMSKGRNNGDIQG